MFTTEMLWLVLNPFVIFLCLETRYSSNGFCSPSVFPKPIGLKRLHLKCVVCLVSVAYLCPCDGMFNTVTMETHGPLAALCKRCIQDRIHVGSNRFLCLSKRTVVLASCHTSVKQNLVENLPYIEN